RTHAPLPVGARPQPVPPERYRLERIGPSAYGVIVGAAQSVFVVTSAGVVVIDSPGSFATALPAAIKRVTGKPVTHVIYSHSHWTTSGRPTGSPTPCGSPTRTRRRSSSRTPTRPGRCRRSPSP